MSTFSGIIPPLCTPLDDDGTVDVRGLEAIVQRHLDAGVHGLFALGSSGEAIYLSDADRRVVLEVVVGTVAGAVPVFAGALDASTARVVDQVRWVARHQIDAVVVTAPFYANVSPDETVRHFEVVAAAATVPVLAYDIPANVGKKLAPEITLDLLTRDVVAGLKDSSGVVADFATVLAGLPAQAGRTSSIFTGSDSGALHALEAGADGIVPGIGNLCADWFVDLWDARAAGDDDKAQRAQQSITAMTEVFRVGERHGLGRHASELGGLKTVLRHDGTIASARLSVPLAAMPGPAVAEVIELVERIRG